MEQSYEKCIDMKEYQVKSCEWSLNSTKKNPHGFERNYPKKIYNNVLEFIGNTPMIKLNNIPKTEGVKCELLAKCEFFNPGGSTKDRIAHRMVQELEKSGKLVPGSTLIEATSGNTGIGIALVGASKGYKTIITLPEKMSQEKCDTLKGLGAKIIKTPTEAPSDSVESHLGTALRLQKEIENAVIPDQYVNAGNALAHYDGTGEEIWEQCDGKVDYVIIGVGTGGTISGIGRKLKEKDPNIQIIGVDPEGSILALPESLNESGKDKPYKVEGIGYDFIPKNCDRNIANKWYKSNDFDSFNWSRRLIKEEGLLVGGSSGSVMAAAMEFVKTLPSDKRVVMVFVDSIRNYMTKFLNDDWMIEGGFYSQSKIDNELKAFGDEALINKYLNNFEEATYVYDTCKVNDVLNKMKETKSNCLAVKNNKEELIALVTKKNLIGLLLNLSLNKDSAIKKGISKEFKKLDSSDPMKFLSKAFLRHDYVLITHETKLYIANSDNMLDVFSQN